MSRLARTIDTISRSLYVDLAKEYRVFADDGPMSMEFSSTDSPQFHTYQTVALSTYELHLCVELPKGEDARAVNYLIRYLYDGLEQDLFDIQTSLMTGRRNDALDTLEDLLNDIRFGLNHNASAREYLNTLRANKNAGKLGNF